jgi:hypothetical protein
MTQLCADVGVRTHMHVSARARVRACVRGTRSARKNRALARQVQGLNFDQSKDGG